MSEWFQESRPSPRYQNLQIPKFWDGGRVAVPRWQCEVVLRLQPPKVVPGPIHWTSYASEHLQEVTSDLHMQLLVCFWNKRVGYKLSHSRCVLKLQIWTRSCFQLLFESALTWGETKSVDAESPLDVDPWGWLRNRIHSKGGVWCVCVCQLRGGNGERKLTILKI